MRTAPPSIVARQKSYALGARLWNSLQVLPHIASFVFWMTMLLDPGLKPLLKPLAVAILISFASMLSLNPWGRAARYRNASKLLGSKIIRYEAAESVSDADLALAAEPAAQILLAPLPLCGKQV